jgi:hypothetical protein
MAMGFMAIQKKIESVFYAALDMTAMLHQADIPKEIRLLKLKNQ